jgi:hypothetical protein
MTHHIEVRWDGEKYIATLYDENDNPIGGTIRTFGEGRYPEHAVGDLLVYGGVEQFIGLRVDVYERGDAYYSPRKRTGDAE